MAEFDIKKFLGGFNLLQGSVRGKLYYHILIAVIVLSGAMFILQKATSKTDVTQVTVQPGGVANISTVKEENRSNWSIGAYVETRVKEFKDASYGLRMDYRL